MQPAGSEVPDEGGVSSPMTRMQTPKQAQPQYSVGARRANRTFQNNQEVHDVAGSTMAAASSRTRPSSSSVPCGHTTQLGHTPCLLPPLQSSSSVRLPEVSLPDDYFPQNPFQLGDCLGPGKNIHFPVNHLKLEEAACPAKNIQFPRILC